MAKTSVKKTNVEYTIRQGAPYRADDAEVIGPELIRLTREHGGKLTTKVVLEAASDPESPLHRFFDWDDESAAQKYRLIQARTLIKAVRYNVKGGEKIEFDLGVFHKITNNGELPDAEPGDGYVTMATIAQVPTFEKQILSEAWRDMRLWAARFKKFEKSLTHLKPIFDAIASVEKIVEEQTKAG